MNLYSIEPINLTAQNPTANNIPNTASANPANSKNDIKYSLKFSAKIPEQAQDFTDRQ